jgi:hypothetical protein
LKRPATTFGREDGQAVILVVVAMSILLIGALGLAIDGGQMYAQRQMAQAAADAAAQAGIMSMFFGTNATSTYPFGTTTASSTCTTTDLRTPCVYARDNGFGGTAADTVTLSYPATVSGVTLSSVAIPALTISVQRTLNTGLIRMVGGAATSSIRALATAGLVGAVSPDCIYVLDPAAPSAFSASNGVTVAVNGCAISVDSTSSSAASVIGGSKVSATAVDVVGGVSLSNGGTITPVAVTGVTPVGDPFASLPALTPGTCTQTGMYFPASNTAIPPGTYCGGISVTNGVTGVTFTAGDYIILGGGLNFAGGTTSSGSGVMFYLTGNLTYLYGSVNMSNGANVTLSAPTSGTYLGVLFFQNRSIVSLLPATFTGGATMLLTGSLYFPTTDVSFSNGTATTAYTAIVADEVSFTGGASINYDNTGLKTGLFSKSVALVQ